jgi:hypothetical protein
MPDKLIPIKGTNLRYRVKRVVISNDTFFYKVCLEEKGKILWIFNGWRKVTDWSQGLYSVSHIALHDLETQMKGLYEAYQDKLNHEGLNQKLDKKFLSEIPSELDSNFLLK